VNVHPFPKLAAQGRESAMKSIVFLTVIFLLYIQTTAFPTAIRLSSGRLLERRRVSDGIVGHENDRRGKKPCLKDKPLAEVDYRC
jgi:hypothetical protein